ncbi:MAG: flagellar hook-length control protein FliK [Marinagarivorans sp.]
MLAPLLNSAPVHTQPGLLNEGPKALQKGRDEQDFKHIFNQQHAQSQHERAEAPVKKDVKNTPGDKSSERARADDSAEPAALPDPAKNAEAVAQEHNAINKDEGSGAPLTDQPNDELNMDANSVEQHDSWSFWLQFAQDAGSPLDKPADADMSTHNNPLMQSADADPTARKILPAQLTAFSVPSDGSAVDSANVPSSLDFTARVELSNTEIASTIKTPFASLDKLDVTKAENVTLKDLTAAQALQEDDGNNALLVENMPNGLTKPQVEFGNLLRDGVNAPEIGLDATHRQSMTVETSQTAPPSAGADNKWLGQAQVAANSADSASVENKSFLQLRFNQQTLPADLVEKTGWLIEHKLETAHIQLDPPELGPIAVKIHNHQEQVSVSFVVANPQVRDAMDQTLQRLKDLLQEQGINLAHADVNDQRQQRDSSGQERSAQAGSGESADDEMHSVPMVHSELVVDHFV